MKEKIFGYMKSYMALSIKGKLKLMLMVVGIFIAVNILVRVGFFYVTKVDVVATITSKERINKPLAEGGFESFYLVYTDKGTYKVVDDLIIFRWNSSDVYGSLKQGSCYSLSAYGLRVPFFSWYKNMYNTKQVDCK